MGSSLQLLNQGGKYSPFSQISIMQILLFLLSASLFRCAVSHVKREAAYEKYHDHGYGDDSYIDHGYEDNRYQGYGKNFDSGFRELSDPSYEGQGEVDIKNNNEEYYGKFYGDHH